MRQLSCLAVVKPISDRVLVMYLGNAMELGGDEEVYGAMPEHPYTEALVSAVPIPDPKLERNKSVELLEGELPSPINPPSGCVFPDSLPKADENCAKQKPPFTSQNNGHFCGLAEGLIKPKCGCMSPPHFLLYNSGTVLRFILA